MVFKFRRLNHYEIINTKNLILSMKFSKSNNFFKNLILSFSFFLLICSSIYSQSSQCILNVKNDRAYFHDRNNTNGKLIFTQRKAFLVLGDQVAINCQDKNENWIYVSYKNTKGTITRGYIKKSGSWKRSVKQLFNKRDFKQVGRRTLPRINFWFCRGKYTIWLWEKKWEVDSIWILY